MEVQRLVFRESVLSPWAGRLGCRKTQPEGTCPRFRTVGSLDAVNDQVGAQGLRPRELLPELVVDTFPSTAAADSRSPSPSSKMPPKKRAGGSARVQARKPKNETQTSVTAILPVEKKSAAEEPENEATLIELARFPGYTPSRPTPLPHSLDTLEQMRRVTRAQAKLAAKREGYREYWRENFYSIASQTIFLDTFWWFFLERYQPHKAVQSSLFSRVAENYVTFLANSEIHTWKDKFLKAYPDALAQCVYTAFIHAFPASWSSFDDSFKSSLVEIIYLWQTGTRPMPELWRRWNFDHLDPPDSLKTIGQEEEPIHRKNTFNLDALVDEARASNNEETPSINGHHLVDKERDREYCSPPAHRSPTPRLKISRAQLEQVLSGGKFAADDDDDDEERGRHTLSQPEKKGSSVNKLDVARSQYISLHQRTIRHPPPRQSTERGELESEKTSATPSTLSVPTPPPPLPHQTPKKTTGNNSGHPMLPKVVPPKPAADTRGGVPRSVRKTCCKRVGQTKGHPRPANKTQTNMPCRHKQRLTEAKVQTLTAHTSPASKQPPANNGPGNVAGSCKPVSTAREFGLPNHVFGDGETSWKEKALSAREKTRQRPLNILQQLHRHQGVPLAVPEMESVCFNQFGRSPLVKHYLQKRRLNKVTGYAILTKRTELNQVIPSGAPTYEDVIQESLKESKKRNLFLTSQKRQSKKQLQGILQERTKKRDIYKQSGITNGLCRTGVL
ncbi:Protein FAM227A [Geodia barretti]|uniref:Protein FAM227A n=1 Tax=Geodia barretti TaxID=519541 RepID=A0AA35RSC6_GEOBA|nr:Protein FAM227A [Geodia barretti]